MPVDVFVHVVDIAIEFFVVILVLGFHERVGERPGSCMLSAAGSCGSIWSGGLCTSASENVSGTGMSSAS